MAASRRAGSGAASGASRAAAPSEPARLAALPPWLTGSATALRRREAGGRLPHALLMRGVAGVGKRAFTRWFAQCVLCRDPGEAGACGACPSCRQLLAGAHPDYRELLPDGAGIKVDAVRELLGWQQMSVPAGRWRVALLDGADTLNRNAANALLKTLEEPADGALLLLIADRPARLPATVRSRCQDVSLTVESHEAARDWLVERIGAADDGAGQAEALLSRSGQAPLVALALAAPEARERAETLHKAWLDLFLHRGSVGRIGDTLSGLPARDCLATFSRLAALALRRRAGLADGPDPAEQAIVSQVFDRLDDAHWFTLRDRVQRLHRIDGPSFKAQAVLEGLLADIRLMVIERTGT